MRGGCLLVSCLLVLLTAAALGVPATSAGPAPPVVADTEPPVGQVISPLPGTWTGNAYLQVRFTDPDGIDVLSLSITVDGMVLGKSWGNFILQAYASGLANGPHTAEARASDNLGNGPAIVSWSFSLDQEQPTVVITSPTGNPLAAGGSVTLTWEGSDIVSGIDHYEVRLDDGPYFGVGTVTSFQFHSLASGVHYFWVMAHDLAGNPNPYSDTPVAIATVPASPSGPGGNTTNQVTVNVPDAVPWWAVALVVINATQAAAVVWLALRQRREPV